MIIGGKNFSGTDFLRGNAEVREACKAAVLQQQILCNPGMYKHSGGTRTFGAWGQRSFC